MEHPSSSQGHKTRQTLQREDRTQRDDSKIQLSEILSVHTHIHAHRADEIDPLAQRGGSLRKSFSKSFLWPGRVTQGGLAGSPAGLLCSRTETLPAVNQFLEAEHF